jgi:hypothetical protein
MKRQLKPNQQKFWNRLTGNHNRRVREQIDYMLKNGTLEPTEHEWLIEKSYTESESEIWRLIIDHIRAATMRDFNMNYQKPTRKRRRKSTKNR